jgi:hypothetical protein
MERKEKGKLSKPSLDLPFIPVGESLPLRELPTIEENRGGGLDPLLCVCVSLTPLDEEEDRLPGRGLPD